MASAITPAGELYTRTRARALNAQDMVAFLADLRRRIGQKILVIWDRSPIHRGDEVQAFLASTAAHGIHMEMLPPYASELNPDDGVWQYLKNVEMRNLCCLDLNHLHHELALAIVRLRSKPRIIQSFFGDANLPIPEEL